MVPGRVVKCKVVKLSRDDSTLAGLGVLAGPSRRRCHALTFHCYNVLSKPGRNPGGPNRPTSSYRGY